MTARMEARAASKGANDVGNDWLLEFPIDCPLHAADDDQESRPPNPYKASHEQYDDAPLSYPTADEVRHCIEEHSKEPSSSCLTLLVDDPLREVVTKTLDKYTVDEYVIEGADELAITHLLDDTAFEQFATKLEDNTLGQSQVSAVILMHHGTTMRNKYRGQHPYWNKALSQEDKLHVKTETCLALRLLRMVCILTTRGAPWLSAIPHQSYNDAVSITELPDFDENIEAIAQSLHEDWDHRL